MLRLFEFLFLVAFAAGNSDTSLFTNPAVSHAFGNYTPATFGAYIAETLAAYTNCTRGWPVGSGMKKYETCQYCMFDTTSFDYSKNLTCDDISDVYCTAYETCSVECAFQQECGKELEKAMLSESYCENGVWKCPRYGCTVEYTFGLAASSTNSASDSSGAFTSGIFDSSDSDTDGTDSSASIRSNTATDKGASAAGSNTLKAIQHLLAVATVLVVMVM